MPAYWYNQSGVIPFKIEENEIKVLLITSRKKRKWIIPKGIVEPHLSALQSARKEAEEEAGVTGEVLPAPIGMFKSEKWDGECTVVVYAMKVNKIFKKWDEDYFRKRKWMTISDAVKAINNQEIVPILKNLEENIITD